MKKEILIVGAIRDCEKQLEVTITLLSKAFSEFEVRYYLVESDSSDNSVAILESLTKLHCNIDFISLGKLETIYNDRVDRITHCRNEYMRYFYSRGGRSQFAYLIVADFDGVVSELDKKSLLEILEDKRWSVCTANQRGPYYDIWALRASDWNEIDCHAEFNTILQNKRWIISRDYYSLILKKMLFRPKSEWIKTESSFGGMAIYRSEIFDNVFYTVQNPNQSRICEHVLFHRNLPSNTSIFINTRLITSGWTKNAKREFLRFILILFFQKSYFSQSQSRISQQNA